MNRAILGATVAGALVFVTSICWSAAIAAHPGHHINEGEYEVDAGAPTGARLVAWFKRTHPRAAARIERDFTKELWKGGA